MEKITEKAVFVVANYIFESVDLFNKELEASESFQKIGHGFTKVPVQSNSPFPLPANFPFPFIAYRDDSSQIFYSVEARRLDILSQKYDTNKELLKKLLQTLAQFKLQEISAIGINYNADCCTKTKRLNIFNEKINNKTISNWDNNIGFKVSIPLSLNDFDCLAKYEVQKVQGGEQDDGSLLDYIYNISVNYNFKIIEDKANVIKRLNKLEDIVKNIDALYDDFSNKCAEITNL